MNMSFSLIENNVLLFLKGHLGNNDDDAFNRCSDFAYRDMCRTIEFNPDYKELSSNSSEQNKIISEKKHILRNKVTGLIKHYVIAHFLHSPEDFDDIHNSLCLEIIEIYKAASNLNYGQAQKWVNMTLKNLYVYSESNRYCRPDVEILSLEPLIPKMHVPIDNIVLDILSGKKKCYVDSQKYNLKRPKINGKEVSWSKWDYKTYIDFQNEIRKTVGENPIIWELQHWSTVEEK